MSGKALSLMVMTLVLAGARADAQTRLGGQRAGTSSGTFLKIPVDPRGAALAGAFVAGAEGVAAVSWNPACLTTLHEPELMFAYVRWPGDVDYSFFAAGFNSTRFRGTFGVQVGHLGTVLRETTEEHPYGTGRSFGVRDWYIGLSYGRRFTDNLSFGITGRFVREDLGTEVGGPSTNNWLVDAGTLYFIDFLDTRLAFAIHSFGPEFKPGGTYVSQVTGAETEYEAFSPPTAFLLGLSTAPIRRTGTSLRTYIEMNHFSDSPETVKFGSQLSLRDALDLRAGYDFYAEAMQFSCGAGIHTSFGFSEGDADYAFTDAGPLGEVHRFALRFSF